MRADGGSVLAAGDGHGDAQADHGEAVGAANQNLANRHHSATLTTPAASRTCVSGDHGCYGGDAVTWDELLARCLAKPGAWRDEPWDGDVVVKVSSKIFAFLGSESASAVGLKCASTREAADEWLLRYPDDAAVMAYIGRSGWNTLRIGGAIPDDELIEAVDSSYDTVVSKLPKKDRPRP
jgi:predicted DNA-binding protein (MmcQ/YjbR family)